MIKLFINIQFLVVFSLLDSDAKVFLKQNRACLKLYNSKAYPDPLGHHLVKSLNFLLVIVEYISSFVFMWSVRSHSNLSLQVADLSTTEVYFVNFLEQVSSNNVLSTSYHNYRYDSINSDESFIVQGTMLGHKMLLGFFFLVEGLPPKGFTKRRFCNIRDFPEVIETVHIGAMPDSDYSMITLAISTFSWGMYVTLLSAMALLVKRLYKATAIQRVLGRLISIAMLLLSIFGIYALKRAKIGMDNYCVCVWEVMKIASVILLGFYINMFIKAQ